MIAKSRRTEDLTYFYEQTQKSTVYDEDLTYFYKFDKQIQLYLYYRKPMA